LATLTEEPDPVEKQRADSTLPHQHSDNDEDGIQKEEKAKLLDPTEVPKFDLPSKIKFCFDRYFPDDAVDNSARLKKFLTEVIGNEAKLCSILKCCTQATTAPAYLRLKQLLSAKFPFKDDGGWQIVVSFGSDDVAIRHNKKERSMEKDGGYEFEWVLSIQLNKQLDTLLNARLEVSNSRSFGFTQLVRLFYHAV
jgi:hypothetical protein